MSSDSILEVTQMLAKNRGLPSIIVSADSGALKGIITDKDFTWRIVVRFAGPLSASTASVMIPHPTCVSMSDSTMEDASANKATYYLIFCFLSRCC